MAFHKTAPGFLEVQEVPTFDRKNVKVPKTSVVRSHEVQKWIQKRRGALAKQKAGAGSSSSSSSSSTPFGNKQASPDKKNLQAGEEGFLRLLWKTIDYDGNEYIDADELELIVGAMRLCFYSVFYFGETSDRQRYRTVRARQQLQSQGGILGGAGNEAKMLGFSSNVPLFLGKDKVGTMKDMLGATHAQQTTGATMFDAASVLMQQEGSKPAGGLKSSGFAKFRKAAAGGAGNDANNNGSSPNGRSSTVSLDGMGTSFSTAMNEKELTPTTLVPENATAIKEPLDPLPDDAAMESLQRRLDTIEIRLSDKEIAAKNAHARKFRGEFEGMLDDINDGVSFLADKADLGEDYQTELSNQQVQRYEDSGAGLVDELHQKITSEERIGEILKELSFRGYCNVNDDAQKLQDQFPGFFDSFLNNVILQYRGESELQAPHSSDGGTQLLKSHRAILDAVDDIHLKLQKKSGEKPILWPEFVDILRPLCRKEIDEDLMYAALPLHLLVQDCLRKKEFARLGTEYNFRTQQYAEAYKMKLKRPVDTDLRSRSPTMKTGENLPSKWFAGKKGQRVSQLSPQRKSPVKEWENYVEEERMAKLLRKKNNRENGEDEDETMISSPPLTPASSVRRSQSPSLVTTTTGTAATGSQATRNSQRNKHVLQTANASLQHQLSSHEPSLQTTLTGSKTTITSDEQDQKKQVPVVAKRPFQTIAFLKFGSRVSNQPMGIGGGNQLLAAAVGGAGVTKNGSLPVGVYNRSQSDLEEESQQTYCRCSLHEKDGDSFPHGPPVLARGMGATVFGPPKTSSLATTYHLTAPPAVGAEGKGEDRPGMIALWSFPGFLDLYKTRMRSRQASSLSERGVGSSPSRSNSLLANLTGGGGGNTPGGSTASPSKNSPVKRGSAATVQSSPSPSANKGRGGTAASPASRPPTAPVVALSRPKKPKVPFKVPPEMSGSSSNANNDNDNNNGKKSSSKATKSAKKEKNPPFVVQHCMNVYGLCLQAVEIVGKRRRDLDTRNWNDMFQSKSDGTVYALRGEGPSSSLMQLSSEDGVFLPLTYNEQVCGPWSRAKNQLVTDICGDLFVTKRIPQRTATAKPLQGLYKWGLFVSTSQAKTQDNTFEDLGPVSLDFDEQTGEAIAVANGSTPAFGNFGPKFPNGEPELLLQWDPQTERVLPIGGWRGYFAVEHTASQFLTVISVKDVKSVQQYRAQGDPIKLNPVMKRIAPLRQIRQFSCGLEFAAWLEGENTVRLLGCNDFGQCGINPELDHAHYMHEPQFLPFTEENPPPRSIAQLEVGAEFGMILAAGSHSVFTWGRGEVGQLGNGTFSASHVAVEITRKVLDRPSYESQVADYLASAVNSAQERSLLAGGDNEDQNKNDNGTKPAAASPSPSSANLLTSSYADSAVSIHVGAHTVLLRAPEVWAVWGRVCEFDMSIPFLMPAVEVVSALLDFKGFYRDSPYDSTVVIPPGASCTELLVNDQGIVVKRTCVLK
ncbi:unnamed protein product [Amoebophrya sp. A120]|nr:unnamed protein product [Amoebophrya sp. A120]|eukprot:GSA120T00016988001.1